MKGHSYNAVMDCYHDEKERGNVILPQVTVNIILRVINCGAWMVLLWEDL